MTTQERFNKVMHWQEPDQVPNMDFGYWEETISIWHKQGLPTYVKTNQDVERYLGLEGTNTIPSLPVINGLYPPFEYKVLEDKGEHRIVRDAEGSICEVPKDGTSIPRYIKHALKTRKDWEIFKRERLECKVLLSSKKITSTSLRGVLDFPTRYNSRQRFYFTVLEPK